MESDASNPISKVQTPKILRVLIIEDVPRDADLVIRELRHAGIACESRVVDTREGMLRELDAFAPDIILSDYTMPQFAGMEALAIRNERAPDLPFVIVTASINEETAVDCIKHGADDYVIKQQLIRLPYVAQNALEKKRLERAERNAQEQALLAAHQWRACFDAIHEGVALLDDDRKILRCNKALHELIGKPWPEIIGHSCSLLVHGFADPPDACPVQRASRTLRRETWETTIGDRRFNLIADPVLDEDGRLTGMVHIFMDITERMRLEAKKEELEVQLRQAQKLEAVGQLAGGVAHDFNNMLGVILGYTEMVLEKTDTADPLHEDLNEVFKAASRARDITRQLLAFARQQTISPRSLDLNAVVDSMLNMLRRLIGEDIDLAWFPKKGLWPVMMDASQIDQILANLCVNARDAISDVGKITIETENINIEADYCSHHMYFVPGRYVMLTVSDNGCGMDRATVDKIFEPFFTTKERGKGTGLGLATIYGIVKQNNGFVNVYSEPGEGTAFKIYLPRHEGAPMPDADAGSTAISKGHGETVLVVEDEQAILNIAVRILEALGYRTLTANTPKAAIQLEREHDGEIHLLMTDVVMPGMNSRDLAERLRETRPGIKCLFMSGYTSDVIAHHGVLEAGVQFIQKPFSARDVATKVRAALDA